MIYRDVFERLAKDGVRYIVAGGIAVNLHGYPRVTMDLDIMLDFSEDNTAKVVSAMDDLGYVPKSPVNSSDFISESKRNEWIEQKHAVVFTFIDKTTPLRMVDIFLTNTVDFKEAFKRKMVVNISGVDIPYLALEDLLKLKELSGRQRDLEDIFHLKRLSKIKGERHDG